MGDNMGTTTDVASQPIWSKFKRLKRESEREENRTKMDRYLNEDEDDAEIGEDLDVLN